jgi:hypothetical protein
VFNEIFDSKDMYTEALKEILDSYVALGKLKHQPTINPSLCKQTNKFMTRFDPPNLKSQT